MAETIPSSRAAIAVSPQRGNVNPQQTVKIKVEAHGLETGTFRSNVRVRIWELRRGEDEHDDEHHVIRSSGAETGPLPSAEKIVDVSGSVVEHTAELVLHQVLEPVHSLFFGPLFVDETHRRATLLRSNGPKPLNFKTSFNFGSNAAKQEAVELKRKYSP